MPACWQGRGWRAAGRALDPVRRLEAIIGAVYLDGGAEVAYDFVQRLLGQRIVDTVHALGALDHKTALQELAVRLFETPPLYRLRDEGPDHAKRFFAEAEVAGRYGATARGGARSRPSRQRLGRRSRPWSAARRRPPLCRPTPERTSMPELPEVEPSAAGSKPGWSGAASSGWRSGGSARCGAHRARRSSTA